MGCVLKTVSFKYSHKKTNGDKSGDLTGHSIGLRVPIHLDLKLLFKNWHIRTTKYER